MIVVWVRQAASYLRAVLDNNTQTIDPNLRPEEFTARKEAQQRAQGSEIITANPEYEAGQGAAAGTPEAYRPKVATWGVFPRPANISKQYGGGRTIRPGEARPPTQTVNANVVRTT